ncbi:leucyl aminopeptidase family protein [Zavarzinia compransoris]|uniref:leucyl aminopeptidase family protein n=1 Tax=Zavarzinia marina TaxID=2911065 RepID=UPI001F257E6F|nr:leucyl aminopeptidase family protein [Zavarzinia marina]MCF4165809.1 leucyl aminopeptidase family protein [Zavarzinia marina]
MSEDPAETFALALPLVAVRDGAVPIHCVARGALDELADRVPPAALRFARASGFDGRPGGHLVVPDAEGGLGLVLFGVGAVQEHQPFAFGALSAALPAATYEIASPLGPMEATAATLGWVMGRYGFRRYRDDSPPDDPLLVPPEGADLDAVRRTAEAMFLVRDLVNTPASDLGPEELAAAAMRLAVAHDARIAITVGDDLLDAGYPMIHAVGRASERAPRLIDMTWGESDLPRVTLVGKGVCFDTGGLNIKTGSYMNLMKKDMGGAAHVLGLAHMIMDADLPVRLRVLIPAVENSVSGNAMRPGDVLTSRKGLTVEIGDTDAEGRLVLADALAEADEEKPDLLVDFATLTGAARVALGPELPALFTPDDELAAAFADHGLEQRDPTWRLPLWPPYDRMLESRVADLSNVGEGGMAGASTAALFLQRFVTDTPSWAHLDVYAWTTKPSPGRPVGAEAYGIRALFALIAERFAS